MTLFLALNRGLRAIGWRIAALVLAVLALTLYAAPFVGVLFASVFGAIAIGFLVGSGSFWIAFPCFIVIIGVYVYPFVQSHSQQAAMSLLEVASEPQHPSDST